MAGEIDKILWDVAIVGSGFAGALIAHELGKGRKNVIVLEAGAGVPPNINAYMRRFYSASAKVPETGLFDPEGSSTVRQYLRSRRRRHVPLARQLPAVCAERFQNEVGVRPARELAD
jgi:choline dehydrogenase-like flavoprotein